MSELKPCPFCGGNNVHQVSVCCIGHSSRWAIVCCDCSARMERSTKQKAINAWNRRADNERIENGVTVQEWISVEDRLPDETKDEYVLVVCEYYDKITVETRKMWHIDSVVTHWMPLPQPPKGE